MSFARVAPLLIFVLLTGCLAETYPGVVIGNPDEEQSPVPGLPGEKPEVPFPDGGAYEPVTSGDPAGGSDSGSGFIDKEPEEEETADAGDQEVPGGDRVGETEEDEEPAPTLPRPEHAEFPQDTLSIVREMRN
jgi:hypothetical protein